MSGWKKITLGVAGTFGLLAVLLGALAVLMPRWINGEAVKAGILARVSRAAGGTLRYERLDLAWFPRPRIVVRRLELAIPHRAAGTVESLTLYPALFPLVRGGYHLAGVRADAPDLTVEIPQPAMEEKPPSFAEIRERIAGLSSALSIDAPGMTFEVHRGRVALSLGPRPLCALREIEGRFILPPNRLDVDIRCASNLWGSLSLNGRLEPAELSGRGTIELVGLDLAPFTESFLPEGWRRDGRRTRRPWRRLRDRPVPHPQGGSARGEHVPVGASGERHADVSGLRSAERSRSTERERSSR